MENETQFIVSKAQAFATVRHFGQKDDDGHDYIFHLNQVVEILKLLTNNPKILCVGWLHDTLEDTNTTYEELLREFGFDIAKWVVQVTHRGQKDLHGYYFPYLKDKEAIMVKFADRLSNISRMNSWPSKRQKQYLRNSRFWRDK